MNITIYIFYTYTLSFNQINFNKYKYINMMIIFVTFCSLYLLYMN